MSTGFTSYTLTVADFLRILVNSARNAGQVDGEDNPNADADVYKLDEKHDAIVEVLNDFARKTWCARERFSIDLAQDQAAVSVSATGFSPDRVTAMTVDSSPWATATVNGSGVVTAIAINQSLIYTVAPTVTISGGNGTGATATATLTNGRVTSFTITAAGTGYTAVPDVLLDGSRVNYDPASSRRDLSVRRCGQDEINADERWRIRSSGTPKLIAFGIPATTATLEPAPKSDGTMTVEFAPLLKFYHSGVEITLTPGDTAASTYTCNIPDDMARTAVRTGGAYILQGGQIQDLQLQNPKALGYQNHVLSNMGIGGSDGPSFQKGSERRADW